MALANEEYVDLAERYLDPEERNYIYARFPDLPRDFRKGCPTCKGQRRYMWRDEERECDCRQQLALHKHYLAANIGELYQRLDWDDFEGDEEALRIVRDYVDQHRPLTQQGLGMILWSQTYGTGKTMLVALVAKECVKLGYRVYFTTFNEMLEIFKRGWNESAERRRFQAKIVESKILVLDDIGKETKHEFTKYLSESTFDHILRQRTVNLLPTLITSNLTPMELKVGYGGNVLSLLEERSLAHPVQGSDWREHARDRSLHEIQQGWTRPVF